MQSLLNIYQKLCDSNQEAFAEGAFVVAYHSLAGAMYCAIGLEDVGLLRNIQQVGNEQINAIRMDYSHHGLVDIPLEFNLYSTLLMVTSSKISLYEHPTVIMTNGKLSV